MIVTQLILASCLLSFYGIVANQPPSPFSLQIICNTPQFPIDFVSWVDFYGRIPPNAVVAGSKLNGSTVYIGQAYHARDGMTIGIYPVEVFEHQKVVKVADNQQIYSSDIFIKVLVGPSELFEWVETNIDTPVNKITKNTLVRGGHLYYYGKVYDYIGRVQKNGEVFIGRAMLNTRDQSVKGLQMIYNENGVNTVETSNFHVLTVKNSTTLCNISKNQINVTY